MRKNILFSILILLIFFPPCFGQLIKVKEPDTRSEWIKGKRYIIKWEKIGKMSEKVKIRLYQDGQKLLSITDSTENDGVYEWVIPKSVQEGYYSIRIRTVDNRVYDDSENFRIVSNKKPKTMIEVISPKNGDVWYKKGKYSIKWDTRSINSEVKISLYKTNSANPQIIIVNPTNNDGEYQWEIPSSIPDGNYKIRIETTDDLAFGDSDIFTIKNTSNAYIFINKPESNSIYFFKDKMKIEWRAGGFDMVVIGELWKGGKNAVKMGKLFEKKGREQDYVFWTITEFLDNSRIISDNDYFIKIYAKNSNNIEARSNKFSIRKYPHINKVSTFSGKVILLNGMDFGKYKPYLPMRIEEEGGVPFNAYNICGGIREWKDGEIILYCDPSLKVGKKYKLWFYSKITDKPVSNIVSFFVSSQTKEDYDLKATNCAYTKNVFTRGETATFSITPYNSGPSTVSGYKITAWSVRGDGASLLNLKGKTNFSDKRQTVLKSGQTKMEYFKVKIGDSPGNYTLFMKVESENPSPTLDKNKNNNLCKIKYKVVYKAKKPLLRVLSFPDLVPIKDKTKSGPNGLEIAVKNMRYLTAKIPVNKSIYIGIRNISDRKFSKNYFEIVLPESSIEELNKKGETVFIPGLHLDFPKFKIIIDSRNSVLEANEGNNELILIR